MSGGIAYLFTQFVGQSVQRIKRRPTDAYGTQKRDFVLLCWVVWKEELTYGGKLLSGGGFHVH